MHSSRWMTRLELTVTLLTLLYVLCRAVFASGDYRYVGQLPAGPKGVAIHAVSIQ